MGKMTLTKIFIDYTIDSITSQGGNFVKENLNQLDSFKRSWRSTSRSAQNIDVDLGAVIENPVIYFDYVNAVVQVIGSDDGDTWNGYDSGALTPLIDPRQRVHRMVKVLTGFNHRYLRVAIAGSQSTFDGEDFYTIGSMPIMNPAHIKALQNNPQYNARHRTAENRGEIVQDMPGGGRKVLSFSKIRPLILSLEFSRDKRKTDTALLWEMFSNLSDTVFVNYGLESWRAYLCSPTTGLQDTWSSVFSEDFDTIELRVNS